MPNGASKQPLRSTQVSRSSSLASGAFTTSTPMVTPQSSPATTGSITGKRLRDLEKPSGDDEDDSDDELITPTRTKRHKSTRTATREKALAFKGMFAEGLSDQAILSMLLSFSYHHRTN